MSRESYSVQETSKKLGIPIQKLRRWDRQGVLVAQRTSGGHRRYSREIIDHLVASCGPGLKENEELASARRSLAAKRRIIQLLLESENRFRDLVETSHDLIWTTDSEGRFTYLNTAAQEIFGLPPALLIGRCFFDFEAKPSHVSNRRFLASLKRRGEVKNFVTHLIGEDGRERWVGINARVSYNDNRAPTGIRGTARDITEQQLSAQRIEHLAKHDPLTNLPNRVSLQQTVETALTQSAVGAVLFIDLDHFKYVNDNFGHKAGDLLIIGVAGALRETLREMAVQIYRLGGDEFAIHLPQGLRTDAIEIAEKVLEAVRHYKLQAAGHRRISNLTASIGVALYPFHGSDIVSVLSSADIAMYQAKDHGRNRYMLYDQEATNLRSTHKRVHWSKKLREALDEDRLVLYAQPVVRLSDRSPVHHEVLVRIREDDGKIVLPGQFIEIAESLGIVQEVDMEVVRKLLAHTKTEKREPKLRYFVNLSRVSISDHRWVRKFHQMMTESGADLSQLVFEITETAAMSEIDVTLSFIRELKELGCRFALDDFGAGFSSFYYLKRFDVDYLKIDGSFIRDLATDEGSQVFVKALCEVARGLSKQVIAEWVEDPRVARLLIEMGAQYGQGFLFQQPTQLGATLIQVQPSIQQSHERK
ncbi:MAG: putative bifunctional diguanylate cyclase/phosphodiesterase [Burkholderiales bacterium]